MKKVYCTQCFIPKSKKINDWVRSTYFELATMSDEQMIAEFRFIAAMYSIKNVISLIKSRDDVYVIIFDHISDGKLYKLKYDEDEKPRCLGKIYIEVDEEKEDAYDK